jgi:hypothetical protein
VATAPLFVADLATLKPKLRLSGVPSTSDADDIINESILVTRQKFYRELGGARITVLLAMAFTETPTTDNQILRAVANSTEVLMVRCELMRLMPMMFMDGNADQNQIMQDEALFRDTTSSQLEQMRMQCELDIQQNMDLLAGDEEIASETTIRIDSPGVSQPVIDISAASRPYPGDSVLPGSVKDQLLRDRTLGNN